MAVLPPSRTTTESSLQIISRIFPRSSPTCTIDHSGQCPPSSTNTALTIGLSVALPVVLIISVLGYFLFRNYRKEKKEMMEHDPDFDETGEATALPDFPQAKGAGYELEDPFHNRNSLRYPVQYPKDNASFAASSKTGGIDTYVDNIVLPYQHQIGSKASLDEFAKNLSEYQPYGHNNPRASAIMSNGMVRGSTSNSSNYQAHNGSRSNLSTYEYNEQAGSGSGLGSGSVSGYGSSSNLPFPEKAQFTSTSPQKSSRKFVDLSKDNDEQSGSVTSSPTKSYTARKGEQPYNAIPNESATSFATAGEYFSGGSSARVNEDTHLANGNTSYRDGDSSFDTTDSSIEETTMTDSDMETEEGIPAPDVDNTYEDDNDRDTLRHANRAVVLPFVAETDHADDDDGFEFSQDSAHNDDTATTSLAPDSKDHIATSNGSGRANGIAMTKSPRLSTLNLLQNYSDDVLAEGEAENEEISVEQEEQIKRMRSVYNVYFDREKSIKSVNGRTDFVPGTEDEAGATQFVHDDLQPLPSLPPHDGLRVNKELKSDTDYAKRHTTASSIYTEAPVFDRQPPQFVYNEQLLQDYQHQLQQHHQNWPQQQQEHYQQYDQFQQPYQQYDQQQSYQQYEQQQSFDPPVELPPLQTLPTASEFRKSTLQTFTDFHPKHKNSSPTHKTPFVPIENDGVWTSPITSPLVNSGSQLFGLDGSLSAGSSPLLGAPSATQLSRSSVVMLNPVTEITKHRKFRPAGSIGGTPNGSTHSLRNQYVDMSYQHLQQQQNPQHPQQHQQESNDLIPGGKDDVRKLMTGGGL